MIKVKAYIKLYKEGRKTPFYSGYRPIFSFGKELYTSGNIQLIDSDKFYPGEEGLVEIVFLNRTYLGDNFNIESHFTFGESPTPIGEGFIKEIYDCGM